MKKMTVQSTHILIVIFAAPVLFTSGCNSASSQSASHETYATKTNYVTVTNVFSQPALSLDLTNRNGLSLRDAQDKALRLTPGMTQDEIILLLGKPDETSAGTYGTQTPHPWQGISWLYFWKKDQNTLFLSAKTLRINFEQGQSAWVVNSWQWY